MEKDLIIREYKEEDKHQILDLLNRNFKGQQHLNIQRDLTWWNWKYKNNIFGNPVINVAEYRNRIIACRPFWPWKLINRDKELKCYQPVDAVVDKEFRGKGIFSKLTSKTLFDNEKNTDLIFNFSNDQSIRANVRLGWTFIGKLQWYVKVNKPVIALKMIRNNISFVSLKLEDEDRVNHTKINQVKSVAGLSGRFETTKEEDFLSWRYMEHPQIYYGMDLIETRDKQLVYIYEINENNFGRELILVDYFGDMNLFKNMLNELDKLSTKYNVAFISLVYKYNAPKNRLYKKLYIKQKRKNLLVLPLNKELEQSSLKYDNWDIFLGMHDSV
ncbi:GNAT family N-acetyltransferase [Lentibacillus salicampi]|uniref:GNAT family N-acetyltransferase n=1 Tax=Lentibacillus salicampi TaxID=175306 RepID=A0A4Y9AF91_9BACI|nr:GNAT family N-acetyltransferase [Lentibacillus salicampi]TFJ93051.1 GNAT family N-acetyltransferase [Lentibacillus salicampi]